MLQRVGRILHRPGARITVWLLSCYSELGEFCVSPCRRDLVVGQSLFRRGRFRMVETPHADPTPCVTPLTSLRCTLSPFPLCIHFGEVICCEKLAAMSTSGCLIYLRFLLFPSPPACLSRFLASQVSRIPDSGLRKKLKVVFRGEEGVDEGGVAKEFFQLLTVQVCRFFYFSLCPWIDGSSYPEGRA